MINLKLISGVAVSAMIVGASAAWYIQGRFCAGEISEIENAAHKAYIEALNVKTERDFLNTQIAAVRAEAFEISNQKREVVTRYVTNEVIKYVQTPDAGKCEFNDDWVRVHDAAASSSLPSADLSTGELDGASRKITDVEVLNVTTQNYEGCNKEIDKLRELQLWARQQGRDVE